MRIAIFSDNFYPEISGISDSIILLSKELANMGCEIHFFVPKYSKKDFAVVNIAYKEIDLGEKISIHRIPSIPYWGSPTQQSRIVIPSFWRYAKFRKEKFDIIFTQSPYGMGIEALLMAKFLGIPLIGTNHTPITEFTRYVPLRNHLFDWIGLKYVSWYYNHCVFITAPYEGILEEMKRYGFRKNCQEISNPIDLKNFFPVSEKEKSELKKKFGFTKKTILYAGRIAPEKQVDVIVKAMIVVKKTIPDAFLAITGIGNAEDELKRLVKELGLESAVKFFGRVDDLTHAETFQASEVFAVMSTAETQCMSMMKAMATGLPVIGADAWALPNYIGRDEEIGYVVQVGDAHGLAEKSIMLLTDTQKARKMGENGIKHVKQFSAEGVAWQWKDIFKRYIK